ncbi:MAG: hypothetical protein Q4D89_09115 [Arachnia propionica]|uniref:hypothetical protein n=1 Tax=Arachnia propionica TaxID=1750 RepID=UPI002703F188|nr:hypothetical protein [Arachnia propionica]
MTAAEAELPTPEDTRSDAYRLAADLQGLASASRATQLGEWNGEGVPGWVGEAEDAYTSSIQYLDGKLNSLVAALNHAVSQAWAWGDALGRAISEIPKLHEAWEEVMIWEAKEKERYSHAVETGEMDPGLAWVGKQSVEEEARQQQSDLRKKHKQLMQDLDDAAAELAGRVNEARAMILPPETGNSRDEIAKNLFDDGSILEVQAKWEWSEERAMEIAEEIREGIDSSDTREVSKRVEEFLDKYGEDLADPLVATALGKLIPPDELTNYFLDTVHRIGDNKVSDQFMGAIGTAMVLASGGVNLSAEAAENQDLYLRFEKALPETRDGALSAHESYAQQMLQAGRSEYTRPWLTGPVSKGFEVMSQMMGQAGLSNPHLAMGDELLLAKDDSGSFMHDVLRHDADVMHDLRHGAEKWHWSGTRRIFVTFDERLEDPIYALSTLMNHPEGFPGSPSEAMLEKERDRLDAVREFLGSEVDGVVSEPINVTEHIMGGRTMSMSFPYGLGSRYNYSGFPDGGVQFSMVAAEAAFPESEEGYDELSSTEQEAWLRRDTLGTTIVEGYVRGYQKGLDVYRPSGIGDIDGQLPYGYENQAMRSVAADVIGPRSKGISLSLGGIDRMSPGMQDGEKARHLVVLDKDTTDKLRGTGGVLVDLAFDGAAPEEGSEGGSRRMTATDKLLLWASNGYADDLRWTIDQDARPANPTAGVPEVTRSWTPVVETLFETPEGASEQLQEIFKKRNETWKPIAGAAGTVGAGAATLMTGPTGGFVATSADATYQSMLDSLLPTDQDTTPGQQYAPTTGLMMGTLATVAAEELDFSKAPQVPSYFLRRSERSSEVVGPGETILPVSSMSPEAMTVFQQYLTSGLREWDFDEALSVMGDSADSTHTQNKEAAEEK